MNPSYSRLKELNPRLNSKTDNELSKLIEAINSCGYEWNENINEFFNKEIGKGIKTSGIDIFTPESFIETYNSGWSDPDWQGAHKYATKLGRIFLLIPVVAIISFIFLKWEYALTITVALILYSIYLDIRMHHYKKRRTEKEIEKEKLNGTYVDITKIEWCLTCVHFKKVLKFERKLNNSEKMLPENKIPCKIYDETKEFWKKYFNSNINDRYLYPKNCVKWEKK